MADQEKIFTDGLFCDEHEFSDGNKITKLSFKVQQFIEFLNQNVNEKGYVNVIVGKAKSGKLYGKVDTWKPKEKQEQGYQPQQQGGYQASDRPPAGGYSGNQGNNFPIADDDGSIPF